MFSARILRDHKVPVPLVTDLFPKIVQYNTQAVTTAEIKFITLLILRRLLPEGGSS